MRGVDTDNKKPITLIVVALILLTGITAGSLVVLRGGEKSAPQKTVASTTKAEVKATTTIQFTAEKGKTVLEQLQDKAAVMVKDSQYGLYVDSINGLKGGTGNKYWSYYVNGQMANIGAGEYITKGGEIIVWKFE